MTRKHIETLLGLALCVGTMTGCGLPIGSLQAPSAGSAVEAQRAYTIMDMEGIGPVYAAKLKAAGMTNTDRFLAATQSRSDRQALAQKTGIPYKNLLKWAQAANMMRISGIGVKQANLLQAVGVASVKELATRNPDNLGERLGVANHVGPHFTHSTPSRATVARWIQAAKALVNRLDDQS